MRSPHVLVFSYLQGIVLSSLIEPEICPRSPFQFSLVPPTHLADGFSRLRGFLSHSNTANRENESPGLHALEKAHSCRGQYCVWTSGEASSVGMSVVTTRANRKRILERSASRTVRSEPPANFRTTEIPGKGIGMIANRRIRKGEPILTAKPAVLVHRKLVDELDLDDQYSLLDVAVSELPPMRREQFLAQAGELGGHKVSDILFTNSFQVILGGEDGQHLGNFPDVSRFNHDCRPNVAFYIDQNLTHHTHAIKEIQSGEELTISYLDSFRARSVRQERAHTSWGFACTCSQCSLPREEADASDARLYKIYQVENQLSDLNNGKSTPDMVEQLIGLYREERLDFKIADAYTIAALNYNQFGMADLARRYADLSLEQGPLEHGTHAPDIEVMRAILEDAEGHWTYNRRPYREVAPDQDEL
ncbi:hypothetical protein JX266_013621 [Neoarthrinium moseri]|nr:hypothetical protein JX266_013621 [Neoarthrinium moseri]